MKRAHLDISLSAIAAIAGSIAAIGAFLTAYYEREHNDLERVPAVHLSCHPEYRLAEIAQRLSVPSDTLLLTPAGGQWLHVTGLDAPQPFARCEVRNFGRLPVLDIHLQLRLSFAGKRDQTIVPIDLPGLSSDASYEFSLLNGGQADMRFAFDRTVELAGVDAPAPVPERLYTDVRVADLERAAVPPAQSAPAPNAGMTPRITIKNFTYLPAELIVPAGARVTFVNDDAEAHTVTSVTRAFDSGTIDANKRWSQVLKTPGRYIFRCNYHPYMQGTIVVRSGHPDVTVRSPRPGS